MCATPPASCATSRSDRFYTVLKAAIIAGLAAGLIMGLFHFVVTEPVIDHAIAWEKEASASPGQASQQVPLVSRGAQKAMVIVGGVIYGLVMGAIFAVIFGLLRRYLPGRQVNVKAGALAGLLLWSVAILPFLKYPANPPGVGNPETVYYRQGIQIGFIALSVVAVVVAGVMHRLLVKRWPDLGLRRLVLVALTYGILAILFFVLMPANPDSLNAPAGIVWDFRILSLSGLVLFWSVMGGTSVLLLGRFPR